jgi:hypothetical protein
MLFYDIPYIILNKFNYFNLYYMLLYFIINYYTLNHYVTTLALSSWLKQGLARVQAKKEA